MKSNFHTHSTFSDGKNTPEEIVLSAIEKDFSAIGFSDHGYTPYDKRYCMTDEEGYRKEIRRLQEKYKDKIQIYLGIEEDSRALVDRTKYDYMIGSCHYVSVKDNVYPLDSNYDYFTKALAFFNGDALALAEQYYQHFCEYIELRKPDVIGHFDLMTKFDENEQNRFLNNTAYWQLAEKYVEKASQSGCIFEVNTGLMARGYRTSPCPHERLLGILCKLGGKVVLSSDSHSVETLDSQFSQMKTLLKNIGFSHTYALCDGVWKPYAL